MVAPSDSRAGKLAAARNLPMSQPVVDGRCDAGGFARQEAKPGRSRALGTIEVKKLNISLLLLLLGERERRGRNAGRRATVLCRVHGARISASRKALRNKERSRRR